MKEGVKCLRSRLKEGARGDGEAVELGEKSRWMQMLGTELVFLRRKAEGDRACWWSAGIAKAIFN